MLGSVKAAVRYRYGGVRHVRLEEMDVPVPREGEVLVRVHAASINRADLDYIGPRPQFIRAFVGLRAPKNPRLGTDVAGASGNVGRFAVQLAKHMGAVVTGAASASKLEFVRSLGADHVFDYREVDFTRQPERYDWIIASDSHHPVLSVRKALWPNGQYATLGGGTLDILEAMAVGPVANLSGSRWSGLMLWWKPFHEPDVRTLTDLVLAGALRPAIDSVYPLEGIVDALAKVDERRASGKVLIRVASV
jgi:NADPH:quinone reductase-like Zn-dependent oxidoreductase